MEKTIIECSLQNIPTYCGRSHTKKCGVYSQRFLWNATPNFGKSRWVVVANIDMDYNKHSTEGLTDEEIVEGCVAFLNNPPRKKYQRRQRTNIYGNLSLYKFSIKEKDGKKYAQVHLVTDKRKNKFFWGQGEQIATKRKK